MDSVCQIGLVRYEDGIITDEWSSYVDPQDYFSPTNISIHGISEDTVKGSPHFSSISEILNSKLEGQIVVSHSHFDRIALTRTYQKYSIASPACVWLDSAKVARRALKEFGTNGFGLKSLASALGFSFTHHDALEDAKAAAIVIEAARKKLGFSISELLDYTQKPISYQKSDRHELEPNPEGSLFGEVIVFTGALTVPRKEAEAMSSNAGCEVLGSVTKKTTIIVVGDQDITKLGGNDKSSKHRKAEELIQNGQPIRILGESDFIRLLKQAE